MIITNNIYYVTISYFLCRCDGENLEVIEQTLPIMVSALIDPKITIGGTNRKLRTAEEFSEGVDIFTELIILNAPDQEIIGQEENRINKMSIEGKP